MVFSSYLFLFYFLPLALALYYAAPRRLRHAVLTGLSYLFYGNLGLLGFFKYFNFGWTTTTRRRRLGLPASRPRERSGSRCRWASASTPSSR
jgi:hypothetical protein